MTIITKPKPLNGLAPTLGLLPVLAISTAVAGPVFAETPIALDQVVLQAGGSAETSYGMETGRARTLTAPLIDTPRTVKVITQRQIEERGATSVEDVLRTTPGVTLGSGEGGTPFGTRPYIRGFEAAFNMSVDGVRSRNRTTYESFNIETIEVNLGSDGVTSGAGAAGGSINMNTKNAQLGQTFNHASIALGNGNQRRATYDGNFAFSPDIAGRLNVLVQDSNFAGSPNATDDKRGLAAALAWQIDSDTKLSFKAQHLKSEGVPDHRVPMANSTWLGNKTLPGYGHFGSGTKADPYLPVETVSRDAYYGVNGRDFRDATSTNISLGIEHDFAPNFRVNSQLSYAESQTKMSVDRPSIAVANGRFVVNRHGNGGNRVQNRGGETINWNTTFSGEFEGAGLRHNLAFGIELGKDKIKTGSTESYSLATALRNADLLNPNPNVPFSRTGSFGPLQTAAQTDTAAFYIFDTIHLSEQWMVNGGVRIERFKLEEGGVEVKDTLKDYQFGVVYKPRNDMSLYASFNTTSSPPGACAAQGGSQCPADSLDESTANSGNERTENTEIGMKWDAFDGNLSFAAALYKTEKVNQRVTDADGNWVLAGNSRGQGVDLSVMGRVTDRWEIVAGYTYLDAKLVNGGANNPDNGNRPVNTAEHTFSLWNTFAVNDRLTLGGGANYVSQKYVNTANTSAMPAYWRVDAMASYALNDKTSLQLNVQNLFDERYYDSSHVGSFATLQPGRSVTARLNMRF